MTSFCRPLHLAALSLLLITAACAVRHESPDGITVEVDANQRAIANITAKEHCAKFGKKAELAYASQPAPSPRLLYLQSLMMSYKCVPK
jgi:L-alanine-DL-glutamate epimerase-like enolase superfamily enzyme